MISDLRYALRMLGKNPGVSAAAALSLALGIGANATIFSWVKAVLIEPLPGVSRQADLVVIANQLRNGDYVAMSYPDYRDYRDRARAFEGVVVNELSAVSLGALRPGEQAQRLIGSLVSGNYFDVLRVKAAHGRTLVAEDARAVNGSPVVVISDALWHRRFGGDPAVVGRTIQLNGQPFTIVGVTPPEFQGTLVGLALDWWAPVTMQPQLVPGGDRLESRGLRWMQAMGRLKPGVSLKEADAEVKLLASQLAQTYPRSNEGYGASVLPLWRSPWGAQFVLGPVLLVLTAVVGVVLLLACANVANLLLARALARRREVAIRLSIGASRSRLVRQLLIESLVLALIGGAAAVVIASIATGALMAFAPQTDLPIRLQFGVDGKVLAFTALVAIATGVAFGLIPALQGSRPDVVNELKDESGSSGGQSRSRFRSALVVAQVALSLLMLVAAGLFLRSLQKSQEISPGFRPDGVLLASYNVFPSGYNDEAGLEFHRRVTERLRALPGVSAVALGRRVPLGMEGFGSTRIEVEGYVPQRDEPMQVNLNTIGPDYFRTMHIRLVAGREFTDRDDRQAPRVAIVNETMARRYWNQVDVVGRRIRVGNDAIEIVGVVPTGKYQTLGERPRPFLYFPLAQMYRPDMVLHVRTAADPAGLAAAVREAVAQLDPTLPLFEVKTLTVHLGFATFTQRLGAALLGAFGLLALTLAAVGLYSVMAYAVSQRTREVGIRMALGARPTDVRRMIVREGMILLAVGLGAGISLAYVSMPFMAPVLVGVTGKDPLTFASVAVLLSGVALGASYIPARRAAAVDPIAALRR